MTDLLRLALGLNLLVVLGKLGGAASDSEAEQQQQQQQPQREKQQRTKRRALLQRVSALCNEVEAGGPQLANLQVCVV